MIAMNTSAESEKRHPIQVVSGRTGLTADVLRVWEKRYGVVEPARSPGGHRLYSDRDVERLSLLHRAISAGRRISRVADLPMEELRDLVREDDDAAVERQRTIEPGIASSPEAHRAACLEAVEALDAVTREKSLMRAAVALSAPALIEQVLGPMLTAIGERWKHGDLSPAKEHLASAVIRRVLESLTTAVMPGPDAPGIVVATPSGQIHEFGALFVAAAAATQGWRVTYLGTNLPASDIADVALQTAASAIAVSLVFPTDDPGIALQLRELRSASGPDIPILAGGRAVAAYGEAIDAAGVRVVAGLEDFYATLSAIETDRAAA